MTELGGFRLELPNGDVFRAPDNNINYSLRTETAYLIGDQSAGGGLVETSFVYASEFLDRSGGQSGKTDGINQSVVVGQKGVHRVDINFVEFEDHTATWGDASASDSAESKMSELDHALNQTGMSSRNVGILEIGEYHNQDVVGDSAEDGRFAPLPVSLGSADLRVDSTEQASTFDGNLVLTESADLSSTIHPAP